MSRSSLPSVAMVNTQCLNELIITCLWLNTAKTIHPWLSKYSFTKQEEGRGVLIWIGVGWLCYILAKRRGAYSKGCLFKGRHWGFMVFRFCSFYTCCQMHHQMRGNSFFFKRLSSAVFCLILLWILSVTLSTKKLNERHSMRSLTSLHTTKELSQSQFTLK